MLRLPARLFMLCRPFIDFYAFFFMWLFLFLNFTLVKLKFCSPVFVITASSMHQSLLTKLFSIEILYCNG